MACTTSISFTALYFLHRRAHITQWRISPGEISLSDRRAPDELAVTGHVATDEGHLEEAESFAREVCALVDRFSGFTSYPKLLSHTLHSAVCSRRKLEEARNELVGILIEQQKLPGLNPWPTLLALLALSQVKFAHGNRVAGRVVLTEARATLESFTSDAGTFPELLERQERHLASPAQNIPWGNSPVGEVKLSFRALRSESIGE